MTDKMETEKVNVVGTRGCTWFVRAPSNNCTISPTDKWISRGEARTVGTCTEGAGAVPLRPALILGGRPPPRLIHYLSTKLFRPPVAHNIHFLDILIRSGLFPPILYS